MLRNLGQAGDRFRQDVRAGAAGNVVQHDRQVARLGDGGEVAVVAFLRRLVVVGADHAARRRRRPSWRSCVRRMASRVLLEPVPGMTLMRPRGLLDHGGDDALVLVVIERRRFAGGADRRQAVGPLLDVPVDELAQGRRSRSRRLRTA